MKEYGSLHVSIYSEIHCIMNDVMLQLQEKKKISFLLSWVKSAVSSCTSCCAENDIISPGWEAMRFYLSSEIHPPPPPHTHTKPQVYDRWRRLIASALYHEWQQEVMNALLYGGRGNEYVGYLSLCLKPFPLSRLFFHFPVTFPSFATSQHVSHPLCFQSPVMYFSVFLRSSFIF